MTRGKPRLKKKVHAAKGSQFDEKKASLYVQVLRALHQAGRLTPHEVEKVARDPLSPLHDCFEWDKDKAAYNYRVTQARHLINHLLIYIVDVTKPTRHVDVHVFKNIKCDDGKRYVPYTELVSNESWRKAIIKDICQRISYWQLEYAQFNELVKMLTEFKKQVRKLGKKIKKK